MIQSAPEYTIAAGTLVRMVHNPGMTGITTGKWRPHGPERTYQVRFANQVMFVPSSQLEEIADEQEDPFDLLARGKFGGASELRRGLTHVRLTGRLADLIYSMESTNTDFYAYQFKPVLKMLNAPNQGLLIADEVGLGKTIEAGLIWTELRSRFDFNRLFVLCPSFLSEKWQSELSSRFGVQAEILDARSIHERLRRSLRDRNYGNFALIGSMQGLRDAKGHEAAKKINAFLEEHAYDEPLIDLLIVDEAHYLKNSESETAKLGRRLRRVANHVVLLSATPVHLGSTDLFNLLNLLDEDTFSHASVFDSILEANAPLVKARDAVQNNRISIADLRHLLLKAKSHPLLFDNRQLAALLEDLPSINAQYDATRRSQLAFKLGEINLLGHTVNRTRKRDVMLERVLREPVAESIPLTPPESKFYNAVTRLVRKYAENMESHEGFLLVLPQRQMSSSMPAAIRSWQRRSEMYGGETVYDDLGEQNGLDQFGPLTRELLRKAPLLGNLNELWENDSKYHRLRDKLLQFWSEFPNEKIVLFSYFRATLAYLSERLTQDGVNCLVLMGGPGYDKDDILKRFASPGGPKILLSSEVASEGIDLQFCRFLINYDLPWNPMKVEQRIGRIDRIGQKASKITIWNLFYGETIDARIYGRLFERLRIFEYTLGGIEPVLGEEIRKLTSDLLSGKLTPQQEENRIDQTYVALKMRQEIEEDLEKEAAHLVAHGDYILNQVQASRRLQRWLSQSDLSNYVLDYFDLHYPGCSFEKLGTEDETYQIVLSIQAKHDLEVFIRKAGIRTSTHLSGHDNRPITCRFDNSVANNNGLHVETINHFHPIVRFVSAKLEESEETQYPAAAVEVEHRHLGGDLSLPPGTYVYTLQRWSIKGLRDQEKLDYLTVHIDTPNEVLTDEQSERLIMTAATHGRDWLQASNQTDLDQVMGIVYNICQPEQYERYKQYILDIGNRNQDLADIQEKTLEKHLERQRESLERSRDEHLRIGNMTGDTRRLNLAKAQEARLQMLADNVERKRLEIGERRNIQADTMNISVGLIHLI